MAAVLELPLYLTEAELEGMTGYRRPSKQMEVLRALCIPACLRADHSVVVMRMHCLAPSQPSNQPVKRPPRVK